MDTKLNLNLASYDWNHIGAFLQIHSLVAMGYHYFEYIKLTDKDEFVKQLQPLYDNSKFGGHAQFSKDNVRVLMVGQKDAYLVASQPNEISEFLTHCPHGIRIGSSDEINIDYFYIGGGETTYSSMSTVISSVVIPELYPDINVDKLSKDFMNAEEPILLLYGEPGTGKTTYLKYLLQKNEYSRIAYIKDNAVMVRSDFWHILSANAYGLVIFDDLSDFNKDFTSNLLSYSDGIFNGCRSKIVITTNQGIDQIDTALVRPGRCFDFLVLNTLNYEQAKLIWCTVLKMNEKDFTDIYSGQAAITQASLMSAFRKSNIGTSLEEKINKAGIVLSNKTTKLGF